MQNWKNTIDLLTAAQTRLKRVEKHLQDTDEKYWVSDIVRAVSIINDVKCALKKEVKK